MSSKSVHRLLLVIFLSYSSSAAGVTCTYEVDSRENVYFCRLDDQVIDSNTNLSVIYGNHLAGFSDEKVLKLDGGNSTIKVFPSPIVEKFKNLKEIWIDTNKIESFFGALESCTFLENVNLSFNRLYALPEAIFSNCQSVLKMMLIGNGIETIHVNAFEGLGNLELLDLQTNSLSTLSAEIFDHIPNLRTLNLFYNKITMFPKEIFNKLPKLEKLNLGMNNIVKWSTNLPSSYPSVRVVNLVQNKITSVEPEEFSSFTNLDELWIGGLLKDIPALNGIPKLTKLFLSHNKIKKASLDSFRTYNDLQELHLSNNLIESVNFTKTSPRILSNLQVLLLNANKIDNLPADSFSALALTTLNLKGNLLKKLEFFLPQNLSFLDVSNNKIRKIERNFFQNITRSVTFRAKGNVCIKEDFVIDSDFEHKAAPLLEKCFNFGVAIRANIIILMALNLLSVLVK